MPTKAAPITGFPQSTESTKLLRAEQESNLEIGLERPHATSHMRKILVTVVTLFQSCAIWISYGVIAPFFPSEAATKGTTAMETGLIFGVFQLTMFFISPIYGKYIKKIGVKPMFLYGSFLLGGCSICLGLMGYAPGGTMFVGLCIFSRVVEANGAAMASTSISTILLQLFPESIGKARAVQQTVTGVAISVGPTVGAGLYSVGGYQLPFMVMGGLVWLIGFISSFMLPHLDGECDAQQHQGDEAHQRGYSITTLLKIPGCIFVYLSIAICYINLTFYEPILSPFLLKKFPSVSIPQIGLVFMIDPAIYALIAPLAGWLTDKGWLAALPVVGLVTQGLSFILLGPSPWWSSAYLDTLGVKCVALIMSGCGSAFAIVPSYSHMLNLVRSHGMDTDLHTIGLISGILKSALSLGGFLGPTLAGLLTHLYGFPLATTLCGLLNVTYAMVFSGYILFMFLNGKWPILSLDRNHGAPTNTFNTQQDS